MKLGGRLRKDKTGSSGADCAWLDHVLWQVDTTVVPNSESGCGDIVIGREWIESDLVLRYGPNKTREFRDKFGGDFDLAVRKPSGKVVNGKDGVVWQDFVMGTDPTDTNSLFRALIEMDANGIPTVTWYPDLNEDGTKSVRTYIMWGSDTLEGGGSWHSPTDALDRFFKVTVEMP